MQLLDPKNMRETLRNLERRPVDEQFKLRLFAGQSNTAERDDATFQPSWRTWGGIAAALMLISAISIGWFATQRNTPTESIVESAPPTNNRHIENTVHNANYIFNETGQDEIIHIDNKPYIRRTHMMLKSREVTRDGQKILIFEPQQETSIDPVDTY